VVNTTRLMQIYHEVLKGLMKEHRLDITSALWSQYNPEAYARAEKVKTDLRSLAMKTAVDLLQKEVIENTITKELHKIWRGEAFDKVLGVDQAKGPDQTVISVVKVKKLYHNTMPKGGVFPTSAFAGSWWSEEPTPYTDKEIIVDIQMESEAV
jgi:hypothetical protein